mmetsp:Transcript_86323/g.244704  ORF Transcript_86323/g.244704 Transcript_86323/m.244704 type:complete len:246 (-) Transcript_86323:1-738(-)
MPKCATWLACMLMRLDPMLFLSSSLIACRPSNVCTAAPSDDSSSRLTSPRTLRSRARASSSWSQSPSILEPCRLEDWTCWSPHRRSHTLRAALLAKRSCRMRVRHFPVRLIASSTSHANLSESRMDKVWSLIWSVTSRRICCDRRLCIYRWDCTASAAACVLRRTLSVRLRACFSTSSVFFSLVGCSLCPRHCLETALAGAPGVRRMLPALMLPLLGLLEARPCGNILWAAVSFPPIPPPTPLRA